MKIKIITLLMVWLVCISCGDVNDKIGPYPDGPHEDITLDILKEVDTLMDQIRENPVFPEINEPLSLARSQAEAAYLGDNTLDHTINFSGNGFEGFVIRGPLKNHEVYHTTISEGQYSHGDTTFRYRGNETHQYKMDVYVTSQSFTTETLSSSEVNYVLLRGEEEINLSFNFVKVGETVTGDLHYNQKRYLAEEVVALMESSGIYFW